ncbi:carboxypeptidase-like regulatory domain-containing protein [Salinimicrobium sediminilitoris]|uniref:carboxypeptidase-like regulatory domain-containing protein n=1 Tax=Salinimicrobium sediminilitoris TaxID=2876715 RepID=UPI001E447131|nr:carboxypeptidase-like regulatory domain-containing protein [Salinimicrobium sediminilitoris]MCC8359752.1 carboxypeptidase-like regulatory domain-containing protein [Salinimicrobium sediminilitoris]
MKNLFVAVLLTLSSQLIFSQVTGTIVDSIEKRPIQYVNVWIKNKALGSTSDHNGEFSIDKAKEGDTLMISYMRLNQRRYWQE